MSIKENWASLDVKAKIGAVCMALASILNLIFVLVFMDAVSEGFDAISGALPFDMEVFMVLYAILFTLLDLLIAFSVIRHKKWARTTGIYWGLWGIASIVMSISSPSAMFAVYGLYVIAAICLLLTKKSEF
ncbi:MAG: hypothetical protein ACI4LX_01195 [Treponema sp.]